MDDLGRNPTETAQISAQMRDYRVAELGQLCVSGLDASHGATVHQLVHQLVHLFSASELFVGLMQEDSQCAVATMWLSSCVAPCAQNGDFSFFHPSSIDPAVRLSPDPSG